MAKSDKRPIAVFQIKHYRAIQNFIGKVRSLSHNISNAPTIFTTPVPTIAVVDGHVDTLVTAEAAAETRAIGAAAQRDIEYNIVLKDVWAWLAYVQSIADLEADELAAIAVIAASGFDVKVNGVIQKPRLKAYNGTLTGTVHLVALGGGPRTCHDWAISVNGSVWTSLIPTINAKTSVTGLPKLSTQFFRHRIITKDGPEAWDQPVSIIVL